MNKKNTPASVTNDPAKQSRGKNATLSTPPKSLQIQSPLSAKEADAINLKVSGLQSDLAAEQERHQRALDKVAVLSSENGRLKASLQKLGVGTGA